MTAVRGPFVFTSDRWSDSFITKAKSAGCGALALQLGVAPGGAFTKTETAGLQAIGWGTCLAGVSATRSLLSVDHPDMWMPQAETTPEFDALIACLQAGVGAGLPIEPVMTAGGIDIAGTDAEKVANRKRRHALLASFNVKHVWVEVYKQDADKSGQAHLGDVNHMIAFFENDLLFGAGNAHPVIGLWTVDASQAWGKNPYQVADYDLSRHGRTFGAWRAEQMADARYPEIAAVPPLAPVPPPPPPSTAPTTAETRTLITEAAQDWEDGQGGVKPLTRPSIIKRISGGEFNQQQWSRLAPVIKATLDLEHQD